MSKASIIIIFIVISLVSFSTWNAIQTQRRSTAYRPTPSITPDTSNNQTIYKSYISPDAKYKLTLQHTFGQSYCTVTLQTAQSPILFPPAIPTQQPCTVYYPDTLEHPNITWTDDQTLSIENPLGTYTSFHIPTRQVTTSTQPPPTVSLPPQSPPTLPSATPPPPLSTEPDDDLP